MAKGFLHLHLTVVTIFILLFTVKLVLLLINRREQLDVLRAKTKIVEMVLGSLILITGGYLLFSAPEKQLWMFVKLGGFLALIPMAIVGLKKGNKVLVVVSWLGFVYFFGVSETKSLKFKKDKIEVVIPVASADSAATTIDTVANATTNDILNANANAGLVQGKAIFEQVCAVCHGKDGALGAGGAANLTVSKLTDEQKKNIILNGKNLMAAYKDQLSESDIEAVAAYVNTLKK
jgi:cytochrome c553